MAKSMKVEDYWRQNNIEGLFKDLTHILAQRMPTDPISAIVQHLQKKFPKSFKTPVDSSPDIGTISKTKIDTLQSQSFTSLHSDTHNDSRAATSFRRQSSNMSQVSGITTLPATGSAFADLLKQNTTNSEEVAPQLNIRNLIFANRLGQQVIKFRKNIQSDHDIIEEELIGPIKTKENLPPTTNTLLHPSSNDHQNTPTHEEPTIKQLIKYKQNIRLENDRRLHRQQLADLAREAREKEKILESDQSKKPVELQDEGEKIDANRTITEMVPETNAFKSTQNIAVRSNEEDVLNEENLFHQRRQRNRFRTKRSTSRSNSPHGHKQFLRELTSTIRKGHGSSVPMVQFGVCKVCGNVMNNEGDQSKAYTKQISDKSADRAYEAQPPSHSDESMSADVDDWFESASQVSGSHEMVTWKPDEVTPTPSGTNPFQQIYFQPIDHQNTNEKQSSLRPTIITDDEKDIRQGRSPRMSESDIFIRTPSPPNRRSSFSRNIPSPVTRKNPSDTLTVNNQHLPKSQSNTSSLQPVPTNEQRISNRNVRELPSNDSNENFFS